MLVLRRGENERILITDGKSEIWVTMCELIVSYGRVASVKVGIEAPDEFKILREEIIGQQPKQS